MATPNEPDFAGRIGPTYRDSEPAWPEAPRPGGPNVVVVALDDTGFAHFGCYGSELATPNIDRLAAGGLRYTAFHTTALCSPSRAALLTGRNHHAVGVRAVSNWNTGFPHMRGGISPRAATVAQVLRPQGYATFAVGKWHIAPMEECTAAGPFTSWPLQKGFDRFYGFMQGETDQFSPELTCDNHPIDPPGRPEDGYHVSEDLVDQATRMVSDLQAHRPGTPFFLYLAFGATHAPHQAPAEYLERWRGRFDEGYDVARQRWYERQLELGVIPPGTELAPPNFGVPAWDDLTPAQQRFAARLQEAFAAQLEHTDAQIGRLVAFLADRGLLDDTLLVVLSDNGASQEGGAHGVFDEFSFFNGVAEDIDEIVATRLDDIGGPHAHTNFPWGWAQAGNAPMRWYKQNTYGGGVRDPLVVHWPNGLDPAQAGALRRQFCHIVDLTPTILDVVGVDLPDEVDGVPQMPLHGASLRATFTDPDAPPPKDVQYFEQMGHRGLWADGWKVVTHHWSGTPFEDDRWALYHLDEDLAEVHDLADEHPELRDRLVARWWEEAERHGVLPLDDRSIELFLLPPRPGSLHDRRRYVYRPPISHVPADASPRLGGKAWTITATVDVPDGGAEGVLYARGNHNLGHSFFLLGGELHFDLNALGLHQRARGPVDLAPGRHELVAAYDATGNTPVLTVAADGVVVGSCEVQRVVRILGSTGTDIGRDSLSPVVDDYEAPFPFTGTIHEVVFEAGTPTREDVEARAAADLSLQ